MGTNSSVKANQVLDKYNEITRIPFIEAYKQWIIKDSWQSDFVYSNCNIIIYTMMKELWNFHSGGMHNEHITISWEGRDDLPSQKKRTFFERLKTWYWFFVERRKKIIWFIGLKFLLNGIKCGAEGICIQGERGIIRLCL